MAGKILVVDDDVDSLKLIGLMLQKRGYEISAANAGAQALSKAATEQPDLIILDVMMPDMDGFEVCRRLRSDPVTQAISIIMFTAKAQVDDKVTGFEAGADDYLTKPTHPAVLASRVEALLARSPARAQARDEEGDVIAFLAAKGGVGTSTLAVNVAAVLAQRQDTVLVDFRPGRGSIGLELGFSRSTGLANLVSKQPDELDARTIEAELVAHSSGLKLLLSSARPTEAQLRMEPDVAETIVERLASLVRTVVLDLGTGLTSLNRRLVKLADQTVMVVEPQRTALLMTRDLIQEMGELGLEHDRASVVLVNRAQSNLQIAWQDAEQLVDHEILAIISSAPELAFQAAEAGFPMILYQPNSIAANQLSRLAEEVATRLRPVANEVARV
jgi:CheY-like chemotaxis protein